MTTAHNNKQRDRLKALLKELFQLDKPELDFGLYKIMHAKSQQITQFLDTDLLKEIEAAFGAESAGRVQQAEHKVAEAIDQAKKFGAPDPEATEGVTEARAAFKLALEGGNTEAEIYDHLYRFFERYYDNGDFLSKRYYARENDGRAAPYSVPYDGREVYLHWANKDQYYIKSGEYLSNFSFDLTEAVRLNRQAQTQGQPVQGFDFGDATVPEGPPLKVHMHLAQAQEGEHGNIKAAGDQKREFIPLLSNPLAFNDQGELVLNFEYKVLPEGYPIDAATEAALKTQYDFKNKGDVPAHWMADVFLRALKTLHKDDARYHSLLAEPVPTDTQKKRPLLAKYIQQYTARNTMDYFIHKDLGGFLRRELDFYIKNELMRLDDIENADAPRVEAYLGKIKALRRIAHQLIAFLAQLEDFQKKLWLKKKFVTETQYCITLDRVPESLYPAIAANDAQREEWVKLFAIDEIAGDTAQVGYSVPLTVEFLVQNKSLMIDSRFFDEKFKEKIIDALDSFDLQIDGVICHSENSQALRLYAEKYKNSIKFIYIDPPYNKGYDGFIYKDAYKQSSWASLIADRVSLHSNVLREDGVLSVSIDDDEFSNLRNILNSKCGEDNHIANLIWDRNHSAQSGFYKIYHEYILNYAKNKNKLNITSSADGFVVAGAMKKESKRHKLQEFKFPAGVNCEAACGTIFSGKWGGAETVEVISGVMEIKEGKTKYPVTLKAAWTQFGQMTKFFDPKKKEKIFDTKNQEIVDFYFSSTGKLKYRKVRTSEIPSSVQRFGTASQSSTALADILGFAINSTPKPVGLNEFLVNYYCEDGDLVMDYFAGSGTTGHAVINFNRDAGGSLKYVLVEQGEYFDNVLVPRIKKSIYSSAWKDGKPVDREGASHCFKYLRLESYEDTLNNLSLQNDPARDRALADNPALRQDYVLNYWLDVETQGSQSLLNVAAFRDPTAYTMRIKQPGSDVMREQRIDLIETFNWLIGLWVEHMAAPQTLEAEFKREVDPVLPKDQDTRLVCKRIKPAESGPYWFRLVEGYTLKVPGDDSSRQKTLVVWRKLTDDAEKDNAVLQHFLMEKLAISPREHTYAVIYVNGSHTLPNPVVEGEQTKVRLIEEAFHAAMWQQDGV